MEHQQPKVRDTNSADDIAVASWKRPRPAVALLQEQAGWQGGAQHPRPSKQCSLPFPWSAAPARSERIPFRQSAGQTHALPRACSASCADPKKAPCFGTPVFMMEAEVPLEEKCAVVKTAALTREGTFKRLRTPATPAMKNTAMLARSAYHASEPRSKSESRPASSLSAQERVRGMEVGLELLTAEERSHARAVLAKAALKRARLQEAIGSRPLTVEEEMTCTPEECRVLR